MSALKETIRYLEKHRKEYLRLITFCHANIGNRIADCKCGENNCRNCESDIILHEMLNELLKE